MDLTSYRTLGRSGLVVSPLALGTMTFGASRWGAGDAEARRLFDSYLDQGGNFIDTADIYAGGASEQLLGKMIGDAGVRDQVVLSTKFGFNDAASPLEAGSGRRGNPNAGGAGAKNIHRALDASLRRLGTDYIDLYWMHAWDHVTPVEEVLQSLGDLVHAGKIRYFGFSDIPAWYATKAATLASVHAIPGPIALQPEYSLIERSIEREHLPASRECSLGVCAWSPLAGGFLTGKYRPDGKEVIGEGRLDTGKGGNNRAQAITERHWHTLSAVRTIAEQVGRTPAQVALAWASAQPGITSLILGASKLEQLNDNLASTDFRLTADQLRILNDISALEPVHPYMITPDVVSRAIFGGASVQGW